MPKYTLLTDHYMFDRVLPAGTKIGDGTMYPFNGEPSREMSGDDDASQALIDKRYAAFANGPVDSLDVNGEAPKDGSAGPRLTSVGEAPKPPYVGNPLIPVPPTGPAQPVQPYASEQITPSAVARPDTSKSVEDRQNDHDALVAQGSRDPAQMTLTPDSPTVSVGNQTTQEEPVLPKSKPAAPATPTVTGKAPADDDKSKK